MKRLLPIFALLVFASVGTVSAQNRDREEIERLKAEIARLKGERVTSPEDIEKLHEEAIALYEQGKYREAKKKAVQAYASFERLPIKAKATRIFLLKGLVNISDALREDDEAMEYAIDITVHATKEVDRLFGYNAIGLAYSNKGEYDKAIRYFEKSLAIKLKTLGPGHPSIAATYSNIGVAYSQKGDHVKAIEHKKKALEIKLKMGFPEHPSVATTYNNIGSSYSKIDDLDGAIEYHEKSLEIKLKTGLPEHPSVATIYHNIGTVYAKKGDKRRAMRYLLQAKAIQLKRLGADHPYTKLTQEWIDALQ